MSHLGNAAAHKSSSPSSLSWLSPSSSDTTTLSYPAASRSRSPHLLFELSTLLGLLLLIAAVLTGCGGGYPGGGLVSVTASATTIDAGQSVAIDATMNGKLPITWAIMSTACSASGCGSLSTGDGDVIEYTAPASVTAPIQVLVQATLTGTADIKNITITVNPAPAIKGTPQSATVGVAYTATLTASGGTGALKLSLGSGSLPPGLTFNAATGVISGNPTSVGTFNFVAQVTDSGTTPDTILANETIAVTAAGAALTVISGNPPNGTVGLPYVTALLASGGTQPYTWTVTSGALPSGLTLSAATGLISGIPTAQGTFTFNAQAQDATGAKASAAFTVVINAAGSGNGPLPITITVTSLPSGTVNVPYSSTIGVTGGTAPYSCLITAGTLQTGLTLGANCLVSGTPTVAGTTTLTVKATDAGNPALTTTGQVTLTIAPATLNLTLGTIAAGTVGVPYSSTIGVSGGTAPYSCIITAGVLPAGLTLGANCLISGTPTTPGTVNLTVKATDSGNPSLTVTGQVTLTIAPAPLSLITGTLPSGTVGIAYSSTIGVTGGTAPYSCLITAGTLQNGLTLGTNCLVSGTPTASGTVNLTVKATDAGNPSLTVTGQVSLTIAPATLVLSTGTLANGTVNIAYSSTIGVSGGTSPYSCLITAGTLQTGLTLGPNCLVSGTPTVAGTATLTVKATDASNPTVTATGQVSLTIAPAPLAITTGTLPSGTVNIAYSSTIGVSGGTSPYSCLITAGTLQTGLALGPNCLVSGTPTVASTVNLTVKATDAANPALTTTGQVSLTIAPATLAVTPGTLPNGTVGTPYSATVAITGGTAPYSCTFTTGTLPAGLSVGANCLVSGTPTVPGTANLTVKATDSGNPAQTASGPETITIVAAPVLVLSGPPAGTVNVTYDGPIGVSGGTAPYTCILKSGTLQTGLTLQTNCHITGTPTVSSTTSISVQATDSSSPATVYTGSVSVTINPATVTITASNPPAATVGTPYTGTIPITGGTAPYTCSLKSGTIPAGLTLNANCTLTGTPTTIVVAPIVITIIDNANPIDTTTAPITITVQAPPALTFTGSLPNAILNQTYTQTLHATGGVGPYTYAVTAGTLPTGITLSSAGVVSGTPTVPGASTFTVTATDSENPAQTASLPLVLLVVYAPTANDTQLIGPYAFLFQGYDDVLVGTLAYQTATIGSFTADGNGAITAGEQDSNHQALNPSTTTVPTTSLLGTYTIGSDDRGMLTLTVLNADGTAGRSTTYAIAVKAPVSPATVAASGSLIEYDGNIVLGSRGSGTFLAQTATAFTTGLSGKYAFGISGDTPCLPACTAGLIAGPVAEVGQFSMASGSLSNGLGDANIATARYTSEALTGTYGTADNNGRLQLSLTTANTPAGYPADYAVYMVSANQAFLMSTDKHSAYILLAGSATSQAATLALNNNYVGYENSPTNPGLVGATLQNVTDLSTATIFRGTADGTGTCNTTNVDVAGTTALVNGLTGLGSGAPILNALLGTYESTGTSNCLVSSGRAVINYPAPNTVLSGTLSLLGLPTTPPPARVAYLTSANAGYFLETGYAGLGYLEQQTGSPFTVATLKGTYVYGSEPAASIASTNGSGVFTADGAGKATTTLDLNVGVGALNILQLGTTGTYNYTLTDAAAGRFVLGGSLVVYTISPTRFVLVDTSAATTSPSVALIY